MDFSAFDTRHYPMLSVADGYSEWAETYESTVVDLMDLRLLERLRSVDWPAMARAADLACGTGRAGVWLKGAGVGEMHGLDATQRMLDRAREKGVYDHLALGDVADTGLGSGTYNLVTTVLADEHIADLGPFYGEAARLLDDGGRFVVVGYHPHFLMMGIAAHFDREPGQSVAIESYVHLASDHVAAAFAAGFRLAEMVEGVIDEAWASVKPKWVAAYRHHPVSFAFVWQRM